MEKEHIQYAMRLNTIGDLIIEISNLIAKPGEEKNLNAAIERYKYVQESLAEVKTPEIVNFEHKKLVTFLGQWISATEILNSVNNDDELKKALRLQKQREEIIGVLCEEIGDILISGKENIPISNNNHSGPRMGG
jgi:hypothetical protein